MDYPRNDSFVRQSSSSSSRLRDPYEHMNRGGGGGCGEVSHRLVRRSPSPEEVPQEMGANQPSGSVERREFGWNIVRRRIGRARPRSPPAAVSGDTGKRPHYDNGVGNSPGNYSPTPMATEPRLRRGELGEMRNPNLDNDDTEFHHTMQASRFGPSDPRISKEELNNVGGSASDKHQLMGKDSAPVKGLSQGSYHHSPTSLGPGATSGYVGGTGGKIPSFSRAMDTQPHFEQGRVQYQDAPPNRLTVAHSFKDPEKSMIQSRDVAYHMIPGSNSKGLVSSTEMSRHEYLAYRDGSHFPQTNEFKSSIKHAEPPTLNVYREVQHLGPVRDPEGAQRNPSYYVRDYSPDDGEHENYYYVKSREVVDDRGYPADEMHKMAVAQQGQLSYGRTQIVYNDDRDMLRPGITHTVIERNDNIDASGGNMRRTVTYYHPVEKPTDSNYADMRRVTYVSKQGGENPGPRYVEVRRTVPEDSELLHMGSASKDHRISDMEAEYVFEGDVVGPQFQEERLILRSPVSKYEMEINRRDVRMLRDAERMYKPQDKVVKGKYSLQEDASTYNPRKTFQGKLYSAREFDELHESGEEWINETTGEVYTSRPRVIQQQPGFRRIERKYDPGDHDEFVSSDEWFPSQEFPHSCKHSVGFHKPYSRPIKGNRRPGYVNHYYNSQQYDRKDHHLYRQRNQTDRRNQQPYRQYNHFDRRNYHHQGYRQQKIWKRNDGYNHEGDMRANDGNNNSDPSEDWVGRQESALAEDSEEFKLLVQDAFLKYSRDLNVNSAVQRRYKEEGKAGSLFCIVCGRSASKEFMDTRRLVTHAFMSHKVGLRANHLGLHKAICVLLGWSTEIPDETITWVPQVLPRAEALAQKEDLILWPPVVVIHNISFSDQNPENWKVVTMDALESFLRGKGFIRARIKVVLGKPADQSVMVIKFQGTFTGLGDAEKLHKYFKESKRGRAELELGSSNDSEASIVKEDEIVEEKLLYGYLGISEDLDRVDLKTRTSGWVKSKIEILDLANDPVKAEEVQQ